MTYNPARPLMEILSMTFEEPEPLHEWLPAGFTLLAAAPKAGKSTLAEQIVEDLSLDQRVLYLALEYNNLMVKHRFRNFGPNHQVKIITQGEIGRLDGREDKLFENAIADSKPSLIVIDVLAALKSATTGGYDDEYASVQALKKTAERYSSSLLALHHTRKQSVHEANDPFQTILGSTALAAVPDNLMVMEQKGDVTRLHQRGRLIESKTHYLRFDGVRYESTEKTGLESFDNAPTHTAILVELAIGPKTVGELAERLRRDRGQISRACAALVTKGEIYRDSRDSPYQLSRSES